MSPAGMSPKPSASSRRWKLGVQQPPSTLRTNARSPRSAARPTAASARDRARTWGWRCGRPVLRASDAEPPGRGRGAAAAGLHCRRRAVARPGLGADAFLHRPPPPRERVTLSAQLAPGIGDKALAAPRAVRPRTRRQRCARCCWTTCTGHWMPWSATDHPRARSNGN